MLSKTLLCCVGRNWREACWEGEKGEVPGSSGEVGLGGKAFKNRDNCVMVFL